MANVDECVQDSESEVEINFAKYFGRHKSLALSRCCASNDGL